MKEPIFPWILVPLVIIAIGLSISHARNNVTTQDLYAVKSYRCRNHVKSLMYAVRGSWFTTANNQDSISKTILEAYNQCMQDTP